jgi:hypothetical protein
MPIYRHRVTGPGSAGDVWVSTLHSEGIAPLADAHEAFRAFVNAALGGSLKTFWATTTGATRIITDQLDPISWKNAAQLDDLNTITGTGTGKAPSPRACLVVGLRTPLPTRAGRGRMFLPSPSSDHYATTGKFVDADMVTLASEFGGALATMRGVVTPVIAHRSSHTTTPITRVTIGDIPGTQRRRTNKDAQNYAGNTF